MAKSPSLKVKVRQKLAFCLRRIAKSDHPILDIGFRFHQLAPTLSVKLSMVGLMPQSRVRVKELEAGNNRFQRMCANMALENEGGIKL